MKNKMLILGIGLAVLWWILESVIHVLVFHEGTFINQIFFPAPHELWMRSLVVGIIIAFAAYAQLGISRSRMAEEALKKHARELKESNRMKDLFTDIMTHDLLNPTGAIKNAADVMLEGAEGAERKLLEVIDWGAEKQIGLIETANKLSKLKSEGELEKESLDLKEVIDRVIEDTRPLFEAAGMQVEANVTKSMPIEANPMIEDVLLNFLSNTVKYAADGEKVVIEALDEGGGCTVMVKDYGQGIPDEYKESVFKRFTRRGKESVKGSGLGLAIAQRIVELHNGKIWIEDNPEGGTVFCVSLPK